MNCLSLWHRPFLRLCFIYSRSTDQRGFGPGLRRRFFSVRDPRVGSGRMMFPCVISVDVVQAFSFSFFRML
jgi:hypothetical protein